MDKSVARNVHPAVVNPIPPGLFEGGAAWGGGGRTINDNEMKLNGEVKDH